jgi:nucleotide-binding universal stress UspA family protein
MEPLAVLDADERRLLTIQPIVVGYDDSRASRAALRWAVREASLRAAPVVVVHVVSSIREWVLAALQVDTDRLRRRAGRELRDVWTAPLRARGVPYTAQVASGRPGPTLLRVARSRRAACVVIGTDHRQRLGVRNDGPVTRYVQHHARRPVIVVPPEPD